MKSRTKKQRRAIGKLVRWIRKQKKRGYDRFLYNRFNQSVIAFKSKDVPTVGELKMIPYTPEHDDSVMAFATMMYAHEVIAESKKDAYAIPVIGNIEQIYTLGVSE